MTLNSEIFFITHGVAAVSAPDSFHVYGTNDVLGEAVAMRVHAGPRAHMQIAVAVTQCDTFKISAENFVRLIRCGQYPLTERLVKRRAVKIMAKRLVKVPSPLRRPSVSCTLH